MRQNYYTVNFAKSQSYNKLKSDKILEMGINKDAIHEDIKYRVNKRGSAI